VSAEIKAAQPPAVAGAPFDFTVMMMANTGHFTVSFVALERTSMNSWDD
jgi:hypothetical protein